ncbi:C40 family peptidase [Salimicrobium sp. PL1-032A]|uniref:C40 family peptidase n=1 Tax=Salimicrobium sp. PL1-032A TaxID=3095364 RepID=UPI0032617DE6
MFKKLSAFLFVVAAVFTIFAPSSSAQSKADDIIDTAYDYSGSPYVWGGTSPSGFDCSGYVQYVYGKHGIDLDRTSRQQALQGEPVSRSNLQPGDLLFFGSPVWHVGIYIGNNKMISAENPGDDIDVASLKYYWGDQLSGARRVIDEDQSHTASLSPGEFHDVSSHYWAEDKISYISQQGIIHGYEGGYFRPNRDVTRGEVAKMMSEALNLGTSSHDRFSDIGSHWSSDYVNAVAAEGYITGYGDGTFRPDESMTREEIASLFDRAFHLSGSANVSFSDVNSGDWSYNAIEDLVANSITHGYEDGTFRPDHTTSRSEFAAFLYNAIR